MKLIKKDENATLDSLPKSYNQEGSAALLPSTCQANGRRLNSVLGTTL